MVAWIFNNLVINGKLISKRCNRNWFLKNNYIEKYEEILLRTSFLLNPSFPQRVWHVSINLLTPYICNNPTCTDHTTFSTFTRGYLRTCSLRCAQLDPETKFTIKSTNLKKYGVEYGLSNKSIIQKKKETCIKNYGVDNPTKSPVILDRISKSNVEKYGMSWILEDQDKKELSVYKKYGVKNVQQSLDIKLKTKISKRSAFYDSLIYTNRLNNKVIPLFTKDDYIKCGYYAEFKFKCINCSCEFLDSMEDGDVPRCTNCYKNSSIFEESIVDFIKSLNVGNIIRCDKTIIHPLELDIVIPDLNIAFECNGLYWHGELNGGKNKNYHSNKTDECVKKNIKLIHIFEDEWLFKQDITKSRIMSLLSVIPTKIYARNCTIKEINSTESNIFLHHNHIQGVDKSSIRFGLYLNNELISVMTFGKLRKSLGNSSSVNTWELYRFCCKLNTTVIGAGGKLLTHFIKNKMPRKIISYADRRWSVGNLYKKLGFKLVSNGSPNYWYFGKGNSYRRYHRFGFAKHTLSRKLINYDLHLSEWENMKNNNYDRIWDCGSLKFEFNVI